MHLDVADVKEQTLEHVFIEIFNFIYEATIPEDYDLSEFMTSNQSGMSAQSSAEFGDEIDLPISNQSL